ncbi:hypothetical protein MKEN_01266500 [Mycena kentingensis (nom. inval.)]|nr:hypothetical protein MKEN_01266500 [Mycena kentingensis (nom. inval.)]
MASLDDLPPGWTSIAYLRPSVYYIILGTIWAACLVPLLCVLVIFSTPTSRRQPIFAMNVFVVLIGIIIGIVNLKFKRYTGEMLAPPAKGFDPKIVLAYIGLIIFIPPFVDCILAYRLYVIYPPRSTPRTLTCIIFIPVLLFKVARLTNLVLFIIAFTHALLNPNPITAFQEFQVIWNREAWTKIEWFLGMFDNCWATGWFLWRLWKSHRTGGARDGSDKIMQLFHIALSSFLFPCLFSIGQVISTFLESDFFLGSYLYVCNVYLQIIGLLFATIWAFKGRAERGAGSTYRRFFSPPIPLPFS